MIVQCAWCKKVKKGDLWVDLGCAEGGTAIGSVFSHSICPACFDKVSEKIVEYKKDEPSGERGAA